MGLYKGRKNVRFYDFMMLGRDMVLHCDEWKQLSPSAKILYICVKAKHNGTNNGNIILHYSELEAVEGLRSPSTVSKAFKELAQKGWITKTSNGGMYRIPNKYGLTGRYDDYITDRSHTVPEKYKEPSFPEVQGHPPIGEDSIGHKISQTKTPSSNPTRPPKSESQDFISRS